MSSPQRFRNSLGENVFRNKYAQGPNDHWDHLAERVVEDVCGTRWGTSNPLMSKDEQKQLTEYIKEMKFIPGGRYLYYAGRPAKFFNNCFLLRCEEDTREEWANIAWRATSCLMVGGGIGIDYSRIRGGGKALSRTGGVSSGPIPLMQMINEIGRNVMQGGSRRSAIYASLNHAHSDINEFLVAKNWHSHTVGDTGHSLKDVKMQDFNFHAPLDMTNISVNYDDNYDHSSGVLENNVRQALSTGEPGFSFNFGEKINETLRNACTEITSEDDSDVCNLGSVNMGNIQTVEEFKDVVRLASKFLVCGTIRADLPYDKVKLVREKNRRLGLGLMGIHEWLLRNGSRYEVTPVLEDWLRVYKEMSEHAANDHCDRFYLNHPIGYRAIAPTGTIGILAGTTTGIEPIYAAAYRRRYLVDGSRWKYEYCVDSTAELMIEKYGVHEFDTALSLSKDMERRIKFQYEVQKYVDHAISSTINIPSNPHPSDEEVVAVTKLILKYWDGLRGLTFYPDGSRGGQPLTEIPVEDGLKHKGVVFEDNSEQACKEGVCGV